MSSILTLFLLIITITSCFASHAHLQHPQLSSIITSDTTFTFICDCGYNNITIPISIDVNTSPVQTCAIQCQQHATYIDVPCVVPTCPNCDPCGWPHCPNGMGYYNTSGCDYVAKDVCTTHTATCITLFDHITIHQNSLTCPTGTMSLKCTCQFNNDPTLHILNITTSIDTPSTTCTNQCAQHYGTTYNGMSCGMYGWSCGTTSNACSNGFQIGENCTSPGGAGTCAGNAICATLPSKIDVTSIPMDQCPSPTQSLV